MCERVDWIHLAQDRDRWPAVVNTVMNRWQFLVQLIHLPDSQLHESAAC
jgi:hypothetical protein